MTPRIRADPASCTDSVAEAPQIPYIIASAATAYGELADSVRMVAVCTSEIQWKLAAPPTLPLRVGVAFPMEVILLTCGGAIETRPPTEWRSLNPAIVSIDSTARQVRTVALGTATVVVTAPYEGREIEIDLTLTIEP